MPKEALFECFQPSSEVGVTDLRAVAYGIATGLSKHPRFLVSLGGNAPSSRSS